MSRTSRITIAVALVTAVSFGAPDNISAQDAPAEVTYRQNIMQGIRTNLMQIRAVGNVNHPSHAVHYARALYGMGEMLGDAFENGSAANSGALPEVWQNRTAFEERVTAFEEATAQLLEAAEMRDEAAVQAAVQALGGTCSACHQAFRAPNDQ